MGRRVFRDSREHRRGSAPQPGRRACAQVRSRQKDRREFHAIAIRALQSVLFWMGLLKKSAGILLLICFLGGCSYLRLQQAPVPSRGDWTMYGGGIGRTNVAHSSVDPPLAPLWEYDASAGFGPFSGAIAGNNLFVGNLSGEVHVVDIP